MEAAARQLAPRPHGMIVLGVDPGSHAHRLRRHRDRRAPPPPASRWASSPRPRGSPFPRSCATSTTASRPSIERAPPDVLAVEDVFHAANTRTALVLGHVRGVVLLAGAQAGLPVHEFPPATVKPQVTGYGRAEKTPGRLHGHAPARAAAARPRPGDATDALAVALCLACTSGATRGRALTAR